MTFKKFCNHLSNGLVYNNDTHSFVAAPCCYFSDTEIISPDTSNNEISRLRRQWAIVDTNKTCGICLDAEASGMYSYRMASFDIMDGNSGDALEMLTISVNKKCNLACPSCGSHSSSRWYRENQRNGVQDAENIIMMHREDRSGDTTENFLRMLSIQDLSHVKYIKFGGGEPLMNDTHLRVLEMIPDPSRVVLQYTSNFSIMPSSAAMATWKKFSLVKWIASVDGHGDQFGFLRWPYEWEDFQQFWTKARTQAPDNVTFGIEHTLNPLNIYYYDRLREWFDTNMAENRYGDVSDFNLHGCTGVMSIAHTPPAVRDMVQQRYGWQHPVMRLLNHHPYSGDTQELTRYLDQIDEWRDSNWREIFPEVQQHYV